MGTGQRGASVESEKLGEVDGCSGFSREKEWNKEQRMNWEKLMDRGAVVSTHSLVYVNPPFTTSLKFLFVDSHRCSSIQHPSASINRLPLLPMPDDTSQTEGYRRRG
ncbi:hypothetical protein EX30DRAFT_343609 [Ascodesmis nigricans]|uniref:Uncharacterized protein n=1 Tax=Ascodesmis nigricans TaxID=341454 RepID=A0A4S2MLU8_9PEZI|nr:hypothetical protein EX30DRAFT_343609 [Ascodesmis nigricans]